MKYKDWLSEWLTLYVKPRTKERTYMKYLRQAHNYIIPYLSGYELDELTAQILQGFTVKLSANGHAANTVNGIIVIIKSSIKKAVNLCVAKHDFSDGFCTCCSPNFTHFLAIFTLPPVRVAFRFAFR